MPNDEEDAADAARITIEVFRSPQGASSLGALINYSYQDRTGKAEDNSTHLKR